MNQMNLFEVLYEKYKITKPIRLIELFGGIGSQAKALEVLQQQGKLPMGFEHYRLVEFDKYPVASYNAVHRTNFVPTDITKIHAQDLGIRERERFEYIMTYSFPCQDLSLAGKGKGMKKGSGTRSGLLWEVERLLIECKHELPQILIMENVPQVIGEKNINDFKAWVTFLENKGYFNYYKILNAKDYGIPQNRQRCFMISVLGNAYYEFPKPIPLKLKLKDMLENDVDEKYYLSNDLKKYILGNAINPELKDMYNRKEAFFNKDIAYCLNTHSLRRIGDSNYIIPNIDHEVKVDEVIKEIKNEEGLLIKEATKKGYAIAKEGDSISLERSNSKTRRGRVGKGVAQTLLTSCEQGVVIKIGNYSPSGHSAASIVDNEGIAPTVMENHGTVTATNVGLKIRKLTPKECWRLMGWSNDADFERAAKVNSNAQLYKQAGNSIVVNCLVAIFSQLL